MSVNPLPDGRAAPERGRGGPAKLPTAFGTFTCYAYDGTGGAHHAAIIAGDLASATEPLLVRVHSSCVTGDIFGSLRCDCGAQLHASLEMIVAEGVGLVVYLDQEGRGIGLTAKMRAYRLQDDGLDTVEANEALGYAADQRTYRDAAEILDDLDVGPIRLLTNNPRKVDELRALGVDVVERVPVVIPPNEHNERYLGVKASKLGHHLPAAGS
ncbi:MAG: GTP cyclohydrolase II [Actinomycetota bacterium]